MIVLLSKIFKLFLGLNGMFIGKDGEVDGYCQYCTLDEGISSFGELGNLPSILILYFRRRNPGS